MIPIRGTHIPSSNGDIHTANSPVFKKRKDNEVKEYRKPTHAPLFVIGAQIYSYNGITLPRNMPLTIDNNTPSINIRFEAPKITQKLVSHHALSLAPP